MLLLKASWGPLTIFWVDARQVQSCPHTAFTLITGDRAGQDDLWGSLEQPPTPTPTLVSSVPSKEHSPFLLCSACLARKQDDEQSNLTSVKTICKGSKSQIPIVFTESGNETDFWLWEMP